MTMRRITPEEAGLSSRAVRDYVKILEQNRLATHDIILAKGDAIFFEKYYPPFDEHFYHRLYSVSKSFVSLAIGFLAQDGKIDLDDPIVKYFPKETEKVTDENVRRQTVRHMLMMATAKTNQYWFTDKPADRVRYYFENPTPSRPSGLLFEYDSSGSFILGALVERVTGKKLTEYLYEKLFSHIGTSKDIRCLTCPGGHSWGDSGILCTARDLLAVARFTMNGGTWDGKRLLNEEYLRLATTKRIDNAEFGEGSSGAGYGYQIWLSENGIFSFNGMGCQFAVCDPKKDLILIYNGDNQGVSFAKEIIFQEFFRRIDEPMQASALAEDREAHEELLRYTAPLSLVCEKGEASSPLADTIAGKTYVLSENPMGISKIRLDFSGDEGTLSYTNKQGDKVLSFGMNRNKIALFPQEGYSKEVGTVYAPGHYYRCASSAAWREPHKLAIKVQIIDEYFGNALFLFSFNGEGGVAVSMDGNAEDFLKEYHGFAGGKLEALSRSESRE